MSHKEDSRPDLNLEWTLEEEKKQLIDSSKQHKSNFSERLNRTDTLMSNNLSTPHPHDSSVKMNTNLNQQFNQPDNVVQVDDDSLDHQTGNNHKQNEIISSSPTTEGDEFQHQLLQRNLRNVSFDGRMLRNSSQDHGFTPYHRYHHRNHYYYNHHHNHSHSHHSTLPTYQDFRASISSVDSMLSYENENISEEESITGSETEHKDTSTLVKETKTSLLKASTTSAGTFESFPGDADEQKHFARSSLLSTGTTNKDDQDLLLFHSANSTLVPNHASLLRNSVLSGEEKQYFVQNNTKNDNDDDATGLGGRLHGASFFTSVSNNNDTTSTAYAFLRRLSSASSTPQQKKLYSATSSPGGETWQHKGLKKKHRTFSLDGKMLRSQLQQYKETVEKQSHLRSETPSGYGTIESSFVAQHKYGLSQDPNYDVNELEGLIAKDDLLYKETKNGNRNDGERLQSLRLSDRFALHDQHLKSNLSNSRNGKWIEITSTFVSSRPCFSPHPQNLFSILFMRY